MKDAARMFAAWALACTWTEAGMAGPLSVQIGIDTPEAIACAHEKMVTEGLGVLFPSEEQAHVPGGIVTFGGGEDTWPPLFRLGLVPEKTKGLTVYPFTVELDDETGEALFRNANRALFYSVAPAYAAATGWFRMRLGVPAFGPIPAYRELSHLVSEWVLVHEDGVESLQVQGRKVQSQKSKVQCHRVQSREVEGLAFAEFEITDSEPSEYAFTISWRENVIATNDVLDLYGAPSLTTNEWFRLASIVATNDFPFELTLSETNFPWYVPPVTCPRPGCSCPACVPVVVTNYAGSAFDPSATNLTMTIATNTTCNCLSGSPTGFFRLFRRSDSDEDCLLDAEEVLVYGTDPLASDSDGDGLPDGWEVVHGLGPLDGTADNGPDGDPDADGVSNRDEQRYGLDPLLADTDGDGSPDLLRMYDWLHYSLWGNQAGFTNLFILSEAHVPEGASAAIRIGTLTFPLTNGTALYHLCIQPGRSYPFRVGCTKGAEARFQILDRSCLPGVSFFDPNGIFSWTPTVHAAGIMSLPQIHLRPISAGFSDCVHEVPGLRTYRVSSFPVSWNELSTPGTTEQNGLRAGNRASGEDFTDRVMVEGFTENADGTLSLSVADTPPSVEIGSIHVSSQLPGQPEYSVTQTIHRCQYDTATDSCPACGEGSHDTWGVQLGIDLDATRLRVGSEDAIRCSVSSESTSEDVNWRLSPDVANGAALYETPDFSWENVYWNGTLTGTVWLQAGNLTNDYEVTAVYPFDPDSIIWRTVSAIAIDAEPICSETNSAGFVYNPCMIPLRQTAQFMVKVFPANVPDEQIVWSVTGGAAFVGLRCGRIVTLRGTETGPVHLEVSIEGYKGDKPTFDTYVKDVVAIPVVACVWGNGFEYATSEGHIADLIESTNKILNQICVSCYVHQVSFTNNEELYDLRNRNDPCFSLKINDILSVQNPLDGLEIHFVKNLDGIEGWHSGNGILLHRETSVPSCAHEIGHSFGLPDLYDCYPGDSRVVIGPVAQPRAPDDWSGSSNRGFYKEGLLQSELIKRHIMYGYGIPQKRDFSVGLVDGLWLSTEFTDLQPNNAPVGFSPSHAIPNPIHR